MTDDAPMNVLMGAIVPLLKANAALSSLIGQRVYDAVPPKATFPYVSLGAGWETPDNADCLTALSVGFRIDVWSRSSTATGFGEVRRIAHRVRTILHDAEIDLSEGALASMEFRRTDVMRDPDGLTSRASVEFSAIIET